MREQELRAGVVSQQPVSPNTVVSGEDIRNSRIQVQGRVQDFGPVTYTSGNDEGLLPPDYRQATEPFRIGKR